MWVYVRFVDDDVFDIVDSKNIKKFDKDDVKLQQKYMVKWKDGDYYKAQIIYVKDSLKELTQLIEERRVRMVNKELLKSGDESSSEEGGTLKIRAILNKKSLDLKKTAIENAKKQNEMSILNKFSTTKPEEKKDYTRGLDSEGRIHNERTSERTIIEIKRENDMWKKENETLRREKKNLEDLNFSLQKEVIELLKDFKNKLVPEMTIPKLDEMKVGQIVGDEVHIGQGFFLKKSTYNSCLVSARSGAQFVKNIAVAIFGIDVLKASSVTGKASNRIKKPDARPPLDSNKLQAIRDIYKHYLLQKGQNEVSLDFDLSKIGLYISSKISDLNRTTRSKQQNKKVLEENNNHNNVNGEMNEMNSFEDEEKNLEMNSLEDDELPEASKSNSNINSFNSSGENME